MKVTSRYTVEDCIFIANHIAQQNNVNSNFWVQIYYYFIFVNCFAFSAFVFYLGYYLAGFVLFIINLCFFLFLGDKIAKENYKAFYRSFFSGDEYKETEIELLENGVICRSVDGDIFFQWYNLKEIVETKNSIYFFTKANGITICKNSFESDSRKQEFLMFAKARIPQYILK